MSKITDETINKVGELIRIKIDNAETKSYRDKLETVLESVNVLEKVNTENVSTLDQTHNLENVMREDEPVPGIDMSKYKNKQNFKNGYFIVERVIEND